MDVAENEGVSPTIGTAPSGEREKRDNDMEKSMKTSRRVKQPRTRQPDTRVDAPKDVEANEPGPDEPQVELSPPNEDLERPVGGEESERVPVESGV